MEVISYLLLNDVGFDPRDDQIEGISFEPERSVDRLKRGLGGTSLRLRDTKKASIRIEVAEGSSQKATLSAWGIQGRELIGEATASNGGYLLRKGQIADAREGIVGTIFEITFDTQELV